MSDFFVFFSLSLPPFLFNPSAFISRPRHCRFFAFLFLSFFLSFLSWKIKTSSIEDELLFSIDMNHARANARFIRWPLNRPVGGFLFLSNLLRFFSRGEEGEKRNLTRTISVYHRVGKRRRWRWWWCKKGIELLSLSHIEEECLFSQRPLRAVD